MKILADECVDLTIVERVRHDGHVNGKLPGVFDVFQEQLCSFPTYLISGLLRDAYPVS